MSIVTHSPDETRAWAAAWRDRLRPGDVVALRGDLGAGKTCFVQGLAAALGVTEPVSSPTYTLVHEYQGENMTLYHIDLYRLHSAEEALDLGLDEYLDGQGITLIEWADRAEAVLPARTIHVTLQHGATENERTLSWTGGEPS